MGKIPRTYLDNTSELDGGFGTFLHSPSVLFLLFQMMAAQGRMNLQLTMMDDKCFGSRLCDIRMLDCVFQATFGGFAAKPPLTKRRVSAVDKNAGMWHFSWSRAFSVFTYICTFGVLQLARQN
jgi:hypothetical protein